MISNVKIVFKIGVQKYSHEAFLIPNLGTFGFHETLYFVKFEGGGFKYGNNF